MLENGENQTLRTSSSMAEHHAHNVKVTGSTPVVSTLEGWQSGNAVVLKTTDSDNGAGVRSPHLPQFAHIV